MTDIVWILKSIKMLALFNIDPSVFLLWLRFSWACFPLECHSLALFLESLVQPSTAKWSKKNKILGSISIGVFTIFLVFALRYYFLFQGHVRSSLEPFAFRAIIFYCLFPVLLSSIFFVAKKLWQKSLPRIVSYQASTFLILIIVPYWVFSFVQAVPMHYPLNFALNSFAFIVLSNLFIIAAAIYGIRKMFGFRFLNMSQHVIEAAQVNFVNEFREIIEQLVQTKKEEEIRTIIQDFFRSGLKIEPHKIHIHLKAIDDEDYYLHVAKETVHCSAESAMDSLVRNVKAFTLHNELEAHTFVELSKILIYDEIAFDNFYHESAAGSAALAFMDAAHLDIFLPIYHKGLLIAFVGVERNARIYSKKVFYTDVERDQMIIFSTYLGNVISLLQQKSLDVLLHKENALRCELFQKEQELAHYRESVQSFGYSGKSSKQIGILLYKNRHFTACNATANDLIKIDPNIYVGHPVSIRLQQLITQTELSGAAHKVVYQDEDANELIFDSVLNKHNQSIIVLVYHPEASDVLYRYRDFLKDSLDLDYVLYLQTTNNGRLINALLPGSDPELFAFKMRFFKAALGKEATLLEHAAELDIPRFVELMHHISKREKLHILSLDRPIVPKDMLENNFGIDELFATKGNFVPLLERLHEYGTLFIKNVQYLPFEIQKLLADYIKTGVFYNARRARTMITDVRILCSIDVPYASLQADETCYAPLFQELKKHMVTFPVLDSFTDMQLHDVMIGLYEHALRQEGHTIFIDLTMHEKARILSRPIKSITSLERRIAVVLAQKKEKYTFIAAKQTDDIAQQELAPDIAAIIALGKNALKDKDAMLTLWNTFKNKKRIADLLNVNRSSVNRRYKELHNI